MKPDDLISLYKHYDSTVMSKESLLIPISIAIIPAVILQWDDMSPASIAVAAVASLVIYAYHLLVIRRFGIIQNNIFEKVGEHYSDFLPLFKCPKWQGIRTLRYVLFFALVLIWVGLFIVHHIGL